MGGGEGGEAGRRSESSARPTRRTPSVGSAAHQPSFFQLSKVVKLAKQRLPSGLYQSRDSPPTHQSPGGEAVPRGGGARWHICGRVAL